ncbi:MAG: cytochrome c biogenesis protein CcdA [Clostridiales bacterium]|nr:cytochrome c biogenesis protein CcdA [Clostridiales bacterium]
MQYLITFLEGIISFISPCILPMLPVYISYFAGDEENKKYVLPRAISFVLGFTLVFSLLGVFAGTLGAFLSKYQIAVNIVSGAIVILFGLSYLDIIPLNFLKGMKAGRKADSIISAFIFGVVYSVSLTPCVGAFLGSAIMMASSSGSAIKGFFLLLIYSMGLGIPFILSAVLISRLGGVFTFIKKHYRIINIISGIFLIVVGVLMALGLMNRLIAVL